MKTFLFWLKCFPHNHIVHIKTCLPLSGAHCNSKLSKANRKQTHFIKWKLVYWCCMYQDMFLWFRRCGKHDFVAVQHVVFYTEHGVMRGKKKRKHFGLAANDSSFSLTFRHDAVLQTHTGPCHRHIWPSNGPVRCTCSRPACCVCIYMEHHGTISATHSQNQGQQKQHSPCPYLICLLLFHSAKMTAELFYLVEKFR